ncbi:DNA pilot protein [Apis mellifera associated microvirus 17]|nr:DNA pilot protein [Apis mellifera associated microvirus 17]
MIPAIIAAVAAVVGAVVTASSARDTERRNDQRANRQMAFQETLANSAHQREMQDLQKAGLNPILAANKGADSPSGVSLQAQNPMGDLNNVTSSAVDAYRTQNETKKLGSELAINEGVLELQKKQGESMVASAKASEAAAEKSKTEAKALSAQMGAISSGAKLEETQNKINQKMVYADAIGNRVGQYVNGVSSARKAFKPKTTDTFYDRGTGQVTREISRP